MKALTLDRPWPYVIFFLGKDVENRAWPPPPSVVGVRIAIHAGKRWSDEAAAFIVETAAPDSTPDERATLLRKMLEHECSTPGALVGSTVVLDYGWDLPGLWSMDLANGKPAYQWALFNSRPFAKAVRCRGQRKLWDIPDSIARRIAGKEV